MTSSKPAKAIKFVAILVAAICNVWKTLLIYVPMKMPICPGMLFGKYDIVLVRESKRHLSVIYIIVNNIAITVVSIIHTFLHFNFFYLTLEVGYL